MQQRSLRARLAPAATVPVLLYAMVLLGLAGGLSMPLYPRTVSRSERLAAFPIRAPGLCHEVEVLWNDHQVPFILARDDQDVPYTLGLVHAHLRRGQMEFFRLVSRGRLSELAGPLTRDIDHAIRVLDLDRAVPAIEARLPDDTRTWLQRYVDGVNDHARLAPALPVELRVLGYRPAPWTVQDVLTLGRLLSVDITWLRWFRVLGLRHEPAYDELMQRLARFSENARPSFGPGTPTPVATLFEAARSGSNSVVVAPGHSTTGGALIASDPHLGLQQPNTWLLAGYRSPGGAAVGMMYPGVPFVLLGRNEAIAWGGTNMQGLSSTLYDVSSFPASSFTERRETIRVRLGPDRTVTARDCELGPVISDAPLLRSLTERPLALRWRGHQWSDEAHALFQVNRARDWTAFRRAFADYAVSGQNLLYADVQGNIGQVMAIEYVPAAGRTARVLPADPANPEHQWTRSLKSTRLPAAFNPEAGFLVSSNNTPIRLDTPIAFMGNADDRVTRLSARIRDGSPLGVEDLLRLQRDAYSASSHRAARAMAEKLGADPAGRALAAWDGHYAIDSRGAALYQQVLHHLCSTTYMSRYGEKLADYLRGSVALHDFVREDLETGAISAATLRDAARAAALEIGETTTWGELHRLRIAHPLGLIPVLGTRLNHGHAPVAGTSSTVWKSAHAVVGQRHVTTYGQNARHVSDLSDPDANYFVLLGGQDGWLGSENQLDQVAMWRAGQVLQIPLREKTVRQRFPHRLALAPTAEARP